MSSALHGSLGRIAALSRSKKSALCSRKCGAGQLHSKGRQWQRSALGDSGGEDKKFITREQEPDSFWQTKTEAKGQNPAKDPLAIMGILGLLVPFLILGLAIATGVVDVNGGK